MENILVSACDNLAIFSTRKLVEYPDLKVKISTEIIEPGVIFVISDNPINKKNLNSINITGFANVKFSNRRSKIVVLTSDNKEGGTSKYVKGKLLFYIKSSTNLPVFVELDTRDDDWFEMYSFYILNGFVQSTYKQFGEKILLVFQNTDSETPIPKPGLNSPPILSAPVFNTQFVKFPKKLALMMAPLIQLDYETGGNICVERIEKRKNTDVLVLGFVLENIAKGEIIKREADAGVQIPNNLIAPFSFHTHPDVVINKIKNYIAWPSSIDIAAIIKFYKFGYNVLAHFICTPEGFWVIYLTDKFQKLLCDLRNANQQDVINAIIENVFNVYSVTEHYRSTRFVDPTKRNFFKRQFIAKSNDLKIKDLPSMLFLNYTGENFNLFKIRLIKWKVVVVEDVLLKFSYFIDPAGGFPRVFKPTCIFPQIIDTDVEMS